MRVVTAAIPIKEGKIFIARRFDRNKRPGQWEFPGGKLEARETLVECLKRELREEFGVEAVVKEYFGTSIYDYPFGRIKLVAFTVEFLAENFTPRDHCEVKWVTRRELDDYEFSPADVPFVEKLKLALEK